MDRSIVEIHLHEIFISEIFLKQYNFLLKIYLDKEERG